MRLWTFIIALALGACLLRVSSAAEAVGGPVIPTVPQNVSCPPCSVGVMGEVARPAVYETHADLTLVDLLRAAGGITRQADPAVRIFRRGRLAEQVFLPSGGSSRLLPGDLVVVERRASGVLQQQAAPSGRPTNAATPTTAVQIAFLNLIDRPVVVKMPSEQATLTAIVTALGLPAETVGQIRVIGPIDVGQHRPDPDPQVAGRLDSGTVLVFPAPVPHLAALAALPPVVPDSRGGSSNRSAEDSGVSATSAVPGSKNKPVTRNQPPDTNKTPTSNATALGPTCTKPSNVEAGPVSDTFKVTAELTDAAGVGERSFVPPSRERAADAPLGIAVDGLGQKLLFQPAEVARQPLAGLAASHALPPDALSPPPRTGEVILFMAALSAIAGAVMLFTIGSIVQRWLRSAKGSFGGLRSPFVPAPRSAGTPVPPLPGWVTGVGRPIRIDASQPITRLSVDLAATERKVSFRSTDR